MNGALFATADIPNHSHFIDNEDDALMTLSHRLKGASVLSNMIRRRIDYDEAKLSSSCTTRSLPKHFTNYDANFRR